MLGFVKQMFLSEMRGFGCNVSSVNPLKGFSMINQECKVRPEILTVMRHL